MDSTTLLTWRARYEDGSFLDQFDETVERKFQDIDTGNLVVLDILDDKNLISRIPLPVGADLIVCEVNNVSYFGYKIIIGDKSYKNILGFKNGVMLLLNDTK